MEAFIEWNSCMNPPFQSHIMVLPSSHRFIYTPANAKRKCTTFGVSASGATAAAVSASGATAAARSPSPHARGLENFFKYQNLVSFVQKK
jgi:hypothetical protein